MPDSSSLTVLLFARYADVIGAATLPLPVPDPATVGAVVARLRRMPGGEALPATPLVAVNARQAHLSDPVRAGDEVALLPPMSGG
jgi:molybdopterin converting factor small subunit